MLGYGAIFFNNSLSVYYILVVVRGWKNHQLLPVRKWLFSAPVIAAFILAFAGIPYYSEDWVACWIELPPYTAENWVYFFGALPILLTTLFSTTAQICVYFAVRSQLRKSSKWRIDNVAAKTTPLRRIDMTGRLVFSKPPVSMVTAGQDTPSTATATGRIGPCLFRYFGVLCSDGAEATVFWQSFFYLTAYYICWLTLLVGIFWGDSQSFGFWCLVASLAPMQGFLNALVYFRPRVMKQRREWLKKRRNQQKSRTQENVSANTKMAEPSLNHSNTVSIRSTVPISFSSCIETNPETGCSLGDDLEGITPSVRDDAGQQGNDEFGEDKGEEEDDEASMSEKFPSLI